jgi:cytochrome c-type biogenesis protein CcmH/NrfG
MPMWPLTAEQVGEIYAYESLVDPSDRDKYLTLSRESYAEGAARDPSDPSVWSQLAGADIALNEYGAARSAVSEALRDEPFSVPALTISGELYVTAAAWSRAISAFGEALSLDPGNVVLETDLSNARAHVAITEPK